jgi:hypothetical protein
MRYALLNAAALAAALGGGRAYAQAIIHEETPGYQSPQHFALELRMGPYRPDIDSEFSGDPATRPQQLYFGTKKRLMVQAELDYQFFQAFGTAAIGLSGGYYAESAKSFVEGGTADQRSNDTTRLTLFPIAVSFVYRLDVAARNFGLPLVPYAKAGLDYWIWRVSNGNGGTATSETPPGHGRGATPGFHLSAGLSLLLDFLDPGAARGLDNDVGVNHTYAFIEITRVEANGLGRTDVMRVGGTAWSAGLMFEF